MVNLRAAFEWTGVTRTTAIRVLCGALRDKALLEQICAGIADRIILGRCKSRVKRRLATYVRFTPESGHVRCSYRCPPWANSGHSAIYSITSSCVEHTDGDGGEMFQ